ncbi:MAG: hypothetical protein LLG45_13265 [Actinomycetia bacterium]|nr:hypothetical protein [Actinomycetes bacterium]
MIELNEYQFAALVAAIVIGTAIVVQKAPKTYAWLKIRLSRLHKKMDSIEGKVPEPLLPAFKAFKDFVAAADEALVDDTLSPEEVTNCIDKADAAYQELVALIKGVKG